jgi:hypothetical protein
VQPDDFQPSQTLAAQQTVPLDSQRKGKIAVTAINHYGDEVLKVFPVK